MRPAPPPRLLVAVAVGGAVGAVLRWLVTELVPDGEGFAWTTFAVNLSGSVALAALPMLIRRQRTWVAALGPGLLGGWTTLSTYSEQTRALLADGRAAVAAGYVLGTLAACLAGVALVSALAPPPTVEDLE